MEFHSFPEKIVKTAKKHRCWGCADFIEKGTKVLKKSGVHIGEGFWNGYFCDKCASFIKNKSSFDWSYHDDGLYMGDLKEYDDYSSHIIQTITLKTN